jgi:hypothetical protein
MYAKFLLTNCETTGGYFGNIGDAPPVASADSTVNIRIGSATSTYNDTIVFPNEVVVGTYLIIYKLTDGAGTWVPPTWTVTNGSKVLALADAGVSNAVSAYPTNTSALATTVELIGVFTCERTTNTAATILVNGGESFVSNGTRIVFSSGTLFGTNTSDGELIITQLNDGVA